MCKIKSRDDNRREILLWILQKKRCFWDFRELPSWIPRSLFLYRNTECFVKKQHALQYEKTLVLQTMQKDAHDPSQYKKDKLMQNKMTEELAEKMKADGKTDVLIMSAGPYKHNSCMSAYCVDAQKMADAAGMLCWTDDGMVRYFSQILFHE